MDVYIQYSIEKRFFGTESLVANLDTLVVVGATIMELPEYWLYGTAYLIIDITYLTIVEYQ